MKLTKYTPMNKLATDLLWDILKNTYFSIFHFTFILISSVVKLLHPLTLSFSSQALSSCLLRPWTYRWDSKLPFRIWSCKHLHLAHQLWYWLRPGWVSFWLGGSRTQQRISFCFVRITSKSFYFYLTFRILLIINLTFSAFIVVTYW